MIDYTRFILPVLLIAPASVLGDDKVNGSLPLRSTSVRNLGGIYGSVGSYYNATARIELTPLIGMYANESVCSNLQEHNITAEFPAILAVTERGSYNEGQNPVNTFLGLWASGYNFSSMAAWPDEFEAVYRSAWRLESSPAVHWIDPEESAVISEAGNPPPYRDYFNLTLERTTQASYSLDGQFSNATNVFYALFNLTLFEPSCSSARATDEYSVWLVNSPSANTEGWNWTSPTVKLQFDGQTANYTLDGYFTAVAEQFSNGTGILKSPSNWVQGKIRITFSGIIDVYHSDVLVNSSAKPTWLPTVGFNNNSMNIDYTEQSFSETRLHPNWSVAMAILFVSVATVFLLWT